MAPEIDCSQRCYDEVSFREWVRWLVDNEVFWVLIAMAFTWIAIWGSYKLLRKRWDEQ